MEEVRLYGAELKLEFGEENSCEISVSVDNKRRFMNRFGNVEGVKDIIEEVEKAMVKLGDVIHKELSKEEE